MKKQTTLQRILSQLAWIADHGGDRAGYVARYGSKDSPDHYGDGGEAIWAADKAELLKLTRNERDKP